MEITRTVPTVLTGRPLTATSLCLSASQLPAQWDPPRTQAAGLGLGACAEDPGWGVVPPLQPSRHGTPILPGQASRTRALDVCSRGPAHSLSHCHPQGFFSYCCPSSGCPCLGLKIGPGYHVWGSQDTLQREQSGLPWGLDSCVSDPRSPLPYNRIQHPQGSLRIRSGPLGYVLSTPAQPHPPEASLEGGLYGTKRWTAVTPAGHWEPYRQCRPGLCPELRLSSPARTLGKLGLC